MESSRVTTFSPAHITGFFQICDEFVDDMHKGSCGAGFSISKGVKTTVSLIDNNRGNINISINGRRDPALVSRKVIYLFFEKYKIHRKCGITVDHQIAVPVGAGLGTSGAGALSLAYALNQAVTNPFSLTEAAQLAHLAEIECGTGLGTVIAETAGGLEIRVKPGAPGIGQVIKMPFNNQLEALLLVFGPLSTKKMLAQEQICKKINKWGSQFLNNILKEQTADSFLKLAREFAEKSGLISTKIRQVLNILDSKKIVASMPMFGEAVFTICKPQQKQEVLAVYNQFSTQARIVVSKLAKEGGRIIHDN